jgi:hypothetical protein
MAVVFLKDNCHSNLVFFSSWSCCSASVKGRGLGLEITSTTADPMASLRNKEIKTINQTVYHSFLITIAMQIWEFGIRFSCVCVTDEEQIVYF